MDAYETMSMIMEPTFHLDKDLLTSTKAKRWGHGRPDPDHRRLGLVLTQ